MTACDPASGWELVAILAAVGVALALGVWYGPR